MTSLLLRATLKLLKGKSREDLKPIALKCGVTLEWLLLLQAGNIKEPGVNKIERLYNCLSGNSVNL